MIFFSFWNSSRVRPQFKTLWQWLRIQRENKAHLGSCLHVHSSKGGNKISPSFQRTKREFFVGFCWEKKGVKFLTSMTGMAREKHTSVPGVFSPVLCRFSPDQPQGGHWCFVLCLRFTDGKKKYMRLSKFQCKLSEFTSRVKGGIGSKCWFLSTFLNPSWKDLVSTTPFLLDAEHIRRLQFPCL